MKYGYTLEEACAAADKLCSYLPPISEKDISLIDLNPSLNFVQKIRLKREMRKQLDGKKN